MAEPAADGEGQPASRRDRLRAATRDEIVQTARTLLLRDGPAAISLRAIARDMGMTAPGLYRYFGSLEELIRNVAASIFTEMAADVDRAVRAAADEYRAAGTTDDRALHTAQMIAACREFRVWALSHEPEFSLLFGVPLPGIDDGRRDIADECALRFAGIYFDLFAKLWQEHPFPIPETDEIDQRLREQIARHSEAMGSDLPLGAMLIFIRCWVLLYGAVAMEVFGHLSFAVDDAAPLFELTLRDMAALIGLDYQPS